MLFRSLAAIAARRANRSLMLKSALKTLLGDQHKREAKKLQPLVDEINEIYAGLSSLSDDELKAKTDEFRAYIEEKTSDLKGEIEELKEAMNDSGAKGMQTFDMALYNLYKDDRITLEEALNNADSRTNLEAKINFG